MSQRRYLEESGQWLENADQTSPVLASGKLVLQKSKLPDKGWSFGRESGNP